MAIFHFTITADRGDMRKVLSNQKFIIEQLLEIKKDMAKTKAEFDEQMQRIEAAQAESAESISNVADDIRRLTEGLTPTGGLTEEEATDLFTKISTTADRAEQTAQQLKSIADQTPENNDEQPSDEEPA